MTKKQSKANKDARRAIKKKADDGLSGWQVGLYTELGVPATEEQAKEVLPKFGCQWEQTEGDGVFLARITPDYKDSLNLNGFFEDGIEGWMLQGEMP